jgi:type VI secretion system protein ImpG
MRCFSTTNANWISCASQAPQFAEKYPKIASRLVLEPSKCEDPHVERLIEAFALLAARIHIKLDDEFPEITEGLLSIVYPQLVRLLPSMSVAEFQPDPEKGKLASGLTIASGTPLYSKPIGGVPTTFRTCYPVTLWPVTVNAAEITAPQPPEAAIGGRRLRPRSSH